MIRSGALIAFLLLPWTVAAEGITGLWLDEDGEGYIRIEREGTHWQGRIAGSVDGEVELDLRNPDPTLRARSLLGAWILQDLEARDGYWFGRVYNPRDGRLYRVRVEVESADRLNVRGYLGVPALGQSQIWTRVPEAGAVP